MSNGDDWAIQISIKHGPKDDRGNPVYLTNVRGYTAADIEGHWANLAEYSSAIHAHISEFDAVANLSGEFTLEQRQAAREQLSEPAPAPQGAPRYKRPEEMRPGEKVPCPVNSRAFHEYRTGVKNGKPWAGVTCSNKPTECAAHWF